MAGHTHRLTTDDDNPTMTRKTGLAYDPIRNEDVEISCRDIHTSTRPEDIGGDELPTIIDSDFRHDPVEACQGSYTEIREIEDGGCPVCGYDRMDHSGYTLPGEYTESCRACGTDITDRHKDDWKPTTRPQSELTRIKQSGAEHVGKTSRRGIDVYVRDGPTGPIFTLVDTHDRIFSFIGTELSSLLGIFLNQYDGEEQPLDEDDGAYIIHRVAEAMPADDEEDNDD